MNGGSGAVPVGEELSHGVGAFLSEVSGCDSLEIIALRHGYSGRGMLSQALTGHSPWPGPS